MEALLIILFAALFAALCSYWAREWGRSFWGFAALAFIVSPIVAAIVGKADK